VRARSLPWCVCVCAYTCVQENDVFPCRARSRRVFCYSPTPRVGIGGLIFECNKKKIPKRVQLLLFHARCSRTHLGAPDGFYSFAKSFYDSHTRSMRKHCRTRDGSNTRLAARRIGWAVCRNIDLNACDFTCVRARGAIRGRTVVTCCSATAVERHRRGSVGRAARTNWRALSFMPLRYRGYDRYSRGYRVTASLPRPGPKRACDRVITDNQQLIGCSVLLDNVIFVVRSRLLSFSLGTTARRRCTSVSVARGYSQCGAYSRAR